MKNKKLLSWVLAAALASTVGIAAGCNPDNGDKGEKLDAPAITLSGNTITWNAVEYTVPVGDTSTKLTGNIYVVGDSTVCGFSDPYYLPRYGYGTQLYNYINCNVNQIYNLALSGRSSKSYTYDVATDSSNAYNKTSESYYEHLCANITSGDYLIIGFGHNDEKADIYTNPNGDKDTAGSFQNSLYTNYVKMAKDKGATPILCTPIVRLDLNDNYNSASGHIVDEVAAGKPGGDYAKAIRDLGADTDTTVIDLTSITKADYTAIGHEKASDYHCWTATKNGVRDGLDKTHTNLYGAKMNAYNIAQEIKKSSLGLAASIKTDSVKPTYDADYQKGINKSYVEPDYKAPDLTKRSTVWNTVNAEGWYASVFGDIGGATAGTTSNYTVQQLSDTSFKIGNTSGKGKIASNGDGIACVFKQLDPNQNFTITAEVTLTNVVDSAAKQSAFGIMFRDEMLVDTYDASVKGNSAIAGGYTGSKDATTCVYNYQRLNGNIDVSDSITGSGATYTQGDTYTIEMVKSDRTITCKVTSSDGTDYVSSYKDATYTGVDTEYVYLCLFATRGIVATFSDVVYTANGISAGA